MDDAEQHWLGKLSDQQRELATRLLTDLRAVGCPDAFDWVRSEVGEGIAQAARYRFLHRLWPDMIDRWGDGIEEYPAARSAMRAGASCDDLVQLARAVAYDTVFAMLYHLDDDRLDRAMAQRLPGWALMETDADGNLTGRLVQGLYEDLLSLDPSGREGQDLM